MTHWVDHPFDPEPWTLTRSGLPTSAGLDETLFALGNGNIGVRGSFEQGAPRHEPGVLVNGFHETWPIVYPETAYGYAHTGQTIVYVPDATVLTVTWDGRLLDLADAEVVRSVDFRTGILTTTARWVELTAVWRRLVSMRHPGVMVQRLDLEFHTEGQVTVTSRIVNRQDREHFVDAAVETDPRRGRSFPRRVLERVEARSAADVATLVYRTAWSTQSVAATVRMTSDLEDRGAWDLGDTDESTRHCRSGVSPGDTSWVEVAAAYERSGDAAAAEEALATVGDFEANATSQGDEFERLWATADVVVEGDPAAQQAVRWSIFQLIQASARVKGLGIPAKGLTGQAYEGHYFWDMDVFVMPFLAATNPRAAEQVIRYRHSILPEARERAETLSVRGALYPWRTISGEEASAYFEAGTAQYHIDADVVYGLRTYVEWTGDEEILWDCGVEIAVETARMWADLGFHDDAGFHIHMVTGPDEYTALVDDNAYTNLMAQMNLRFAADVVERMRTEQEDRFRELASRVGLEDGEVVEWRQAAGAMYVGRDAELGIVVQDATFLSREPWDWSTPRDRYPLLLHFHPLVIYRHQVLKQADVVMADFVLPEATTSDEKRRNFEFYDPITTGDSSLSASVQAAAASRIGRGEDALAHFRRAASLDLADLAGNSGDGVHLACAAGVWLALVRGFGGIAVAGDTLTTDPRLPDAWSGMTINVEFRGEARRLDLT